MAKKYENLNPIPLFGSYSDPFGDRRGTGPVRPDEPLDSDEPDFLREFDSSGLYFAWLGHSSVFINMHGKSILIDPVFSRHASPVPFAGMTRFPGKAISCAELPAIDLVLITHNHYDHLDKATIRALDAQVGRYIVPSDMGKNLCSFGISPSKITELGWYEEYSQDGLRIVSTPSQHDSSRSLFDMNRTLWCSYVLTDGSRTVFDSGDGGFGEHFAELHERFGDIDLAIMECGQYNEKWHTIHMFPEESVQAAAILNARLAVPVHWGAYTLSDHAWDDPPRRFAIRATELGVNFRIPKLNEIIEL